MVLDRLSKRWADGLGDGSVGIFRPFVELRLSRNSGVAFGIPLSGLPQLAVTLAVMAAVAVAFWKERGRGRRISQFGYVSVLAGAAGNAFDRILTGKVTDFVAVEHFAIFNVADIFITFGACLLILDAILHERSSAR